MFWSRLNCSVMIELPKELVEVIWLEPRDLAELPLEGRRDRRRHDLGARAGIEGGHLDGGVVDLREGRDRELRVGHEAHQEEADHQERRRDGAEDEEPGRVHDAAAGGGSWGAGAGLPGGCANLDLAPGLHLLVAVGHDLLPGGDAVVDRR